MDELQNFRKHNKGTLARGTTFMTLSCGWPQRCYKWRGFLQQGSLRGELRSAPRAVARLWQHENSKRVCPHRGECRCNAHLLLQPTQCADSDSSCKYPTYRFHLELFSLFSARQVFEVSFLSDREQTSGTNERFVMEVIGANLRLSLGVVHRQWRIIGSAERYGSIRYLVINIG